MQTNCLFCKIVNKEIESFPIWETNNHLAFLSIYPNTPGTTVVIPKKHFTSYAFDLPDEALKELIVAAKHVGKLLDNKLKNVGRTALVFEGFGVDHVHAKLFPMHGTGSMTNWQPIKSDVDKYFHHYEGYISSHDYKLADKDELRALTQLIRD